jgi:hypothetical protein
MTRSGATYDPLNNSFQVKPENLATMQMNDWATKQHEDFMRMNSVHRVDDEVL